MSVHCFSPSIAGWKKSDKMRWSEKISFRIPQDHCGLNREFRYSMEYLCYSFLFRSEWCWKLGLFNGLDPISNEQGTANLHTSALGLGWPDLFWTIGPAAKVEILVPPKKEYSGASFDWWEASPLLNRYSRSDSTISSSVRAFFSLRNQTFLFATKGEGRLVS